MKKTDTDSLSESPIPWQKKSESFLQSLNHTFGWKISHIPHRVSSLLQHLTVIRFWSCTVPLTPSRNFTPMGGQSTCTLSYIYAYVNKSILKLNICVRLSVSVLLHYNFKVNVILTYVNKSILKLNICVLLSVSVSLHYNCIVMHVMLQGV